MLISAGNCKYNNETYNEQICYANTFTITNTGSLAALVTTSLSNVTNTYSDKLKYEVFINTPVSLTGTTLTNTNSLNGLANNTYLPATTNNTKTYTILIWLDESAVNTDQSASYTATINTTGIQTNTEFVELDGVLYDTNGNILIDTDMMLESTPIYTKTDESGYFNFGYVPIGNHKVTVTSNNTKIIEDTFTIQKGVQNSVINKTVVATNQVKLSIKQKVDTTAEINLYTEAIAASSPELPNGMIPIKYDGTNWVKADETNTNND